MAFLMYLFLLVLFAGPVRVMKFIKEGLLSGLRGWKELYCKWSKDRAEKKAEKIKFTDTSDKKDIKFTDKSDEIAPMN